MKIFKLLKRTVIFTGIIYIWAVRSFKPTAREMLDPSWHRELPMRITARGLARLLPYLDARWGEKGVKALQFVFYQIGVDRAPLLQEFLEIDVDDARSLGRVLDYEDGLVGVKGIWVEETRGRAVKEERYCPAAAELSACPEVCTSLFMAMEAGTFSQLNPELRAPEISKLLSRGDECCLAVLELPHLKKKEARSASPQATPGELPPRLSVPGLRGKLMRSSLLSIVKAAYKLATSGLDQPMHWYEHFRYVPAQGPTMSRRKAGGIGQF